MQKKCLSNLSIKALVLQLGNDNGDPYYRSNRIYDPNFDGWWNEDDLIKRQIPVVINYNIHKDNVVGVVENLEKMKDNKIIGTLILNGSDENVVLRAESAIYHVGLRNIQISENEGIIGQIDCVSMNSKKNFPFKRKNTIMVFKAEKTTKPAKCEKEIYIKSGNLDVDGG